MSTNDKPQTNDRDTLLKVAAGYNELMALQAQQRAAMAKMIRACLAQLRSTDSRKRREAIDGLASLANMLEGRDTNDGKEG